ncbi:CRPV-100 [Crowpox virus]|nr:CRPV-100 [Crowpox virus]
MLSYILYTVNKTTISVSMRGFIIFGSLRSRMYSTRF